MHGKKAASRGLEAHFPRANNSIYSCQTAVLRLARCSSQQSPSSVITTTLKDRKPIGGNPRQGAKCQLQRESLPSRG